jgi:hypothetical protein
MFDNFRFPKAPHVPICGLIVEFREEHEPPEEDCERVLVGGEIAWPWDFSPIVALLPDIDIPYIYTKEGDETVVFIDENGRVGIIPVSVAKRAYKPIYEETATIEDHIANFQKYQKLTQSFEMAGWELIGVEAFNKVFTEETDADFVSRRNADPGYVHGDYDPIPRSILSTIPNLEFWYCTSCGHPHDLMFYHEKNCERCEHPLELRDVVEGAIGTIVILSDDEASFPGLDKEDWV